MESELLIPIYQERPNFDQEIKLSYDDLVERRKMRKEKENNRCQCFPHEYSFNSELTLGLHENSHQCAKAFEEKVLRAYRDGYDRVGNSFLMKDGKCYLHVISSDDGFVNLDSNVELSGREFEAYKFGRKTMKTVLKHLHTQGMEFATLTPWGHIDFGLDEKERNTKMRRHYKIAGFISIASGIILTILAPVVYFLFFNV